jgi:hypothetical protein
MEIRKPFAALSTNLSPMMKTGPRSWKPQPARRYRLLSAKQCILPARYRIRSGDYGPCSASRQSWRKARSDEASHPAHIECAPFLPHGACCCLFALARSPQAVRRRHWLTSAHPAASVARDGPPDWEVKREAGASALNSGAAPATVSGEPQANATGNFPGRRLMATTRKPGDLPSRTVLWRRRGGVHRTEASVMAVAAVTRDPTKLVAERP